MPLMQASAPTVIMISQPQSLLAPQNQLTDVLATALLNFSKHLLLTRLTTVPGDQAIDLVGMHKITKMHHGNSFQARPPVTHRHRQAPHQAGIQQTVTNPTVKVPARQPVTHPLIEEISRAISTIYPQKEPSMQQPDKHPMIKKVPTCTSRPSPWETRAAGEQMSNVGHGKISKPRPQDCFPCHSSNPATAPRPILPSTTTCSGEFFRGGKPLNIASISTDGLRGNAAYIDQLLAKNTVVCIQEHWVYRFETDTIYNLFKQCSGCITCSDNADQIPLKLCPIGSAGVAIMWDRKWDKFLPNGGDVSSPCIWTQQLILWC